MCKLSMNCWGNGPVFAIKASGCTAVFLLLRPAPLQSCRRGGLAAAAGSRFPTNAKGGCHALFRRAVRHLSAYSLLPGQVPVLRLFLPPGLPGGAAGLLRCPAAGTAQKYPPAQHAVFRRRNAGAALPRPGGPADRGRQPTAGGGDHAGGQPRRGNAGDAEGFPRRRGNAHQLWRAERRRRPAAPPGPHPHRGGGRAGAGLGGAGGL